MGHCHYKKGNLAAAFECYDFASTFFNRPTDIHLIDIRLGNNYLEFEDYNRAKTTFLNICKTSPTSNTWLGLGIACYHVRNFSIICNTRHGYR